MKPEHGIISSGALYVVLVKFDWCAAFSFEHRKLENSRKYQQEWYECYKANQWNKADWFGAVVFSRKKKIKGGIVENTDYNSLPA